ncbi:hypothetical protein FHU29_000933 [Hoyosella altamirensis]|uniref:Uncharacterized protein n=1 Tax=Hoyosella altamirensis TaxID=616997 RepID=A0A839RJM5_9ACTN|nr:hypothetical protein [Hoyosella altamirensis]
MSDAVSQMGETQQDGLPRSVIETVVVGDDEQILLFWLVSLVFDALLRGCAGAGLG